MVLGTSAQELFAGIQERARRHVMHRIRLLARRLERQAKNPLLAQKVEFLRAVLKGGTEELRYEPITEK
jgi:C4-dicarboxylate-specific signal transduction histidine kinase